MVHDVTSISIPLAVTIVVVINATALFHHLRLDGGISTIQEQNSCRDVTCCICVNSVKVQYVHMLSLALDLALVLTLPVILYPSTEMLKIWLDKHAGVT